MTREELERHHEYLNNKYDEIYLAGKQDKERLKDNVRSYVNMNDELYVLLSEGYGSGLFRHGFFDSDMSKSIRILKHALDSEEL